MWLRARLVCEALNTIPGQKTNLKPRTEQRNDWYKPILPTFKRSEEMAVICLKQPGYTVISCLKTNNRIRRNAAAL